MDQDVDDKALHLVTMNLIVKRIERELNQLKNLIKFQMSGLTASSGTNCDENIDTNGNPDTSISIDESVYCPMDILKIENDQITIIEDHNYEEDIVNNYEQEVFNNEQEDNCQNRPLNNQQLSFFTQNFEDITEVNHDDQEGIIVDKLQKILKKVENEAKSQGTRSEKSHLNLRSKRTTKDRKAKMSQNKLKNNLPAESKTQDISSKTKNVKKSHICSTCSKSFQNFSNLLRHMTIHTGTRPYKCKICSKSFTNVSNLKRHNLVHTGEKPFSCSICSKSFALNHQRNRHKMLVHPDRKEKKTHRKSERKILPFKCKICPKSFCRRDSLKRHHFIHTDKLSIAKKPLSCSICSREFLYFSELNRHMRIHTGEKPYTCSICSKSFSQTSTLNHHKKIQHKGEKQNKVKMSA